MKSLAMTTSRDSGPWRLLLLYARGRGLATCALLVLASWLLLVPFRQWASYDSLGGWGRMELVKQFGVVHLIPALAASVIGVSSWSPIGDSERAVASLLPRLRLAHIGGLLAASAVLAWLLFLTWESREPSASLWLVSVRNLIGFSGMALLLGRILDARQSWLVAVLWSLLAMGVAIVTPMDRVWLEPWWLWSGRSQASISSWAVALMLGGAGITTGVLHGARDDSVDPGEA